MCYTWVNQNKKCSALRKEPNIRNIFDVIPPVDENSGTFILDHGKVVDGVLKSKDDLTSYGWNIRRYNRLKEGALVLVEDLGS